MLEVGESATTAVRAQPRWSDTGIELVGGAEYRFVATGRWWDSVIPCGPAGYASRLLRFAERWRRAPAANWFALIGAVAADETRLFPIGAGATVVAPASGVLTCFANDASWARWNNWGAVELTVTRLS